MSIFDDIRKKYGFAIPSAYRAMFDAGWFDPKKDYLWVHEAEWLTPKEILKHEPADYHKPGFVPFAFTGAGDEWCWWPEAGEELVVLCPHDSSEGQYDAPSFAGSLYRRMLEYALGAFAEEQEARDQLNEWSVRLQPHFPSTWHETLRELARSPLVRWQKGRDGNTGLCTFDHYEAIVQRDLSFPLLDQTFEWMIR